MAVHPQIAEVLRSLPAAPAGPPDPAFLREVETHGLPAVSDRVPVHSVEDVVADTAVGPVPVRIYTPVATDEYGLLVYFHGGAFFLGSLETHDQVARSLAAASGFRVVSVDYRLAPENAFPAGLQDCYAVVRWVAETSANLSGDGRLAVAGDSSGANFVAAVTSMALDDGFDGITHQVLFYPSLDLDFDTERYASLRENAVGYGLETAGLKPFNAFYLDSGADPDDPLVSPIKRKDVSGLPPALIITAEHDPLRDEGEVYGQMLADAGVPATVTRYAGATHGFVQHFAWIPEYGAAFTQTADFLQGST